MRKRGRCFEPSRHIDFIFVIAHDHKQDDQKLILSPIKQLKQKQLATGCNRLTLTVHLPITCNKY